MEKKTDKKSARQGWHCGCLCSWFWCCKILLQNSSPCHRAKHMRGPGVRATKRKVGRWQVQLLLPPNEVSQLISNSAHGLQNGWCFLSASSDPPGISWSPACRKHTRETPGTCPSVLPGCIRKPSWVLILWFWIWEANERCEAMLRSLAGMTPGKGSDEQGEEAKAGRHFSSSGRGWRDAGPTVTVVTKQPKKVSCTELGVWAPAEAGGGGAGGGRSKAKA